MTCTRDLNFIRCTSFCYITLIFCHLNIIPAENYLVASKIQFSFNDNSTWLFITFIFAATTTDTFEIELQKLLILSECFTYFSAKLLIFEYLMKIKMVMNNKRVKKKNKSNNN